MGRLTGHTIGNYRRSLSWSGLDPHQDYQSGNWSKYAEPPCEVEGICAGRNKAEIGGRPINPGSGETQRAA
jgi:hypothetical protein